MELLTNTDSAFRRGAFKQFAERWARRVRCRCAYVASGSGIAERCHLPPETAPTRAQTFIVMMRNFRCFQRVDDKRKGILTVRKKYTALCPGEAAEKAIPG